MIASRVVAALEYERQLLMEFRDLSKEQLLLFEDFCSEAVKPIVQQRDDLLLELAAIEATLGSWIEQIGSDSVSPDVISQLQLINAAIVQLASKVIELDEQTYRRMVQSKCGRAHVNDSGGT